MCYHPRTFSVIKIIRKSRHRLWQAGRGNDVLPFPSAAEAVFLLPVHAVSRGILLEDLLAVVEAPREQKEGRGLGQAATGNLNQPPFLICWENPSCVDPVVKFSSPVARWAMAGFATCAACI